MRDYFFEGIKRLDWGFGNPNITAAMIACLMMAIWFFAWVHRSGFWVALSGFAVLAVMLIQTVSRGGMVAAVIGAAVLVWFAPRPWPRVRWVAVVTCVLGLLVFSMWHGVASRYGKGIVEEDRSVSNRWLLYRVAPGMISDAPGGWGMKRAGEAFHNFYQPEGRVERYGSLVSSHLTWLAEFNWLGRFGYLIGWLTIMFLCWPSEKSRWFGPALATLVAFGAASAFTMMTNRWWMWIVPVVAVLPVIIARLLRREWPGRRKWAYLTGGTCILLLSVFCAGKVVAVGAPVQLKNGFVTLGDIKPSRTFYVLSINQEIMGRAYGQRLRKALADEKLQGVQVQVEWDSAPVHPDGKDFVVVVGDGVKQLEGERLASVRKAAGLILLNPGPPSKELFENLNQMPSVLVNWGEFNPGQDRLVWQALARQNKNVEFETVSAAGKYLPDWVNCLHQ